MPPKKQIDRQTIRMRAFELTRQSGFDAITARSLAAALGCSTQPIYQAFADMKALERETARMAFDEMLRQLSEAPTEGESPQLAWVLAYIRFARTEPHLFALIMRNGLFAQTPEEPLPISALDPKLIIFANGIVFMNACQTLQLSWAQTEAIVQAAARDFQVIHEGGNEHASGH